MSILNKLTKTKAYLVEPERIVWLILLALITFCMIASPIFTKPRNLTNVFLKQPVGMGIASIGQAFVIISGGIDLSTGSVISLLTSVTAGLFQHSPDMSLARVVLIILGMGVAIGTINGFIVVVLRVTPFMATLATMSVFQGAALYYTKKTIGGIPRNFRLIADGSVGGIPFSILYLILVMMICYLVLNRNRLGRHLYAVGSDSYVARISGIALNRVRFLAYVIAGLLVATASMFLAARMGGGGPKVGVGYELDSITAVVIGGVALSGGVGSLTGVFGGVLIISVFQNIMNLLDVSPFYQMLLKGLILIMAVSFYSGKYK